jgi:hypothetical protein
MDIARQSKIAEESPFLENPKLFVREKIVDKIRFEWADECPRNSAMTFSSIVPPWICPKLSHYSNAYHPLPSDLIRISWKSYHMEALMAVTWHPEPPSDWRGERSPIVHARNIFLFQCLVLGLTYTTLVMMWKIKVNDEGSVIVFVCHSKKLDKMSRLLNCYRANLNTTRPYIKKDIDKHYSTSWLTGNFNSSIYRLTNRDYSFAKRPLSVRISFFISFGFVIRDRIEAKRFCDPVHGST